MISKKRIKYLRGFILAIIDKSKLKNSEKIYALAEVIAFLGFESGFEDGKE